MAGVSVAAVVALTAVLLTWSGESRRWRPRHRGTTSAYTQAGNGTAKSAPGTLIARHSAKTTVTTATGRDIIAKGTLRLRTTRAALRRDVARLTALAGEFGGYVSAADLAETGSHPGGTMMP